MKIHPLLLLSTLTLFSLHSARAADPVIWSAGHGDLGIGYVDGELEPHWHLGENDEEVVLDGTPSNDPAGFEFAPNGVIAQTSLSGLRDADSAWNAVGVSANGTYYLFPEPSDVNTPYVGIGLEELVPDDWDGNITLTLTARTGPLGGEFSLYQVDLGTPTFFMSTFGGISGADSVSLVPGTHTHFNWAFTETGTYNLTFEISGTHLVDGAKTASATYTFNAVPEPTSIALIALGGAALFLHRRRKAKMS